MRKSGQEDCRMQAPLHIYAPDWDIRAAKARLGPEERSTCYDMACLLGLVAQRVKTYRSQSDQPVAGEKPELGCAS